MTVSQQERTEVLDSLKERAKLVADTFNSIEGMKCNQVTGAMYAFPRIFLPKGAIAAAKVTKCKEVLLYVKRVLLLFYFFAQTLITDRIYFVCSQEFI